MDTVEELNTRIRTLIRTVLGMPENSVRPANQNAPTGTTAEQFATVLLTVFEPTGQDELRRKNVDFPSTDIVETVIGQRRVVASVQFFRGDAYSKAIRLATKLNSSSAIDAMRAAGLGLVRTSPARNTTTVVDTLYEQRGQIDLEFYVIAAEAENVRTYGTFPIALDTSTHPPQHFEVFEP